MACHYTVGITGHLAIIDCLWLLPFAPHRAMHEGEAYG